ncbi:MAG TPA: CHAT domain-containing tetratricopeptide repeat protein [Thermoanaerobaculia bacterium]
MIAALALLTASAALAAPPSIDRAIDLHTSGQLEEALREYRAVAAAEPEMRGVALTNVCALQMDLGEYRAALPDCREALRLSRKTGDPGEIAWALNNLALDLQALGKTAEAERLFREALGINRRRGDAESQVINLSNLGTLALAAGRYSAALRLQDEAAALASRHRDEPWAAEQTAIARINQGAVLEKVGAYREALDLYKGMLADAGGLDRGRRAALLVNSGVIYRNLGDPVRAVESFREAVEAYREAGDQAGLSNAWLNLGLAHYLNLERPGEAEAAYREALRLAEASGDRTEEIQDLFYLGQLLLEQGRLEEAETVYGRSLTIAIQAGSAEGRWSAREGLGRIARARGDLDGALSHFELALVEIEQVRAGLSRGGRRSGYFGDKRAVYAATVGALVERDHREPGQGWAERALEVVLRAKARDLLDALGEAGGSRAPLGGLRRRVGNGAALEYFAGEDHLYLWVIRGSGIRLHDLGKAKPVLDAVARVHRALSRGEKPPAAAVTALSRVLLASARPLPRGEELLRIAPDGALHYLPFEILEDPAVPGRPLVERVAVSYLPSASMLMELEGKQTRAGVWLAGFADPRLPRPGSGPSSPRDLLVERFGLAPLPASDRELKTVGRLLSGSTALFTGDLATEQAFRKAVTRGARVVHFATHTVIDERPGRGAAILLTAAGEDDGLLYPEEIARLPGRSDLTVLAACRTALGPGGEGQALATLTGSFLAAGSQGVVATLWDMGDAATAAFMEQFYWELGQGRKPAEALRRAKLRLRQDPRWRRPDLWAGYVLIGEAPAVTPGRRAWWVWGLGGLLVAIGVWWLWRAPARLLP